MVRQFPGALPIFRRFNADFVITARFCVETKGNIIRVDLFVVVVIDIPHIIISQYHGVRSRGKNQLPFTFVNNVRQQPLHTLSVKTVDLNEAGVR